MEIRKIFPWFVIVTLANSFLWLDSLDKYFAIRFHIDLTQALPEKFFEPSIRIKQLFMTGKENQITNIVSNGQQKRTDHTNALELDSNYAELPLKSSAFKIMFAGDSMMQGVAPIAISHLRKLYPKSTFDDLSKQSTGLTVKRYFDWPTKIKEGIAKENYKVIIIFLGPNDPWDIYENKKVYKFPSPEWEEIYRLRVEDILSFAKEHDAYIIWVGLPNMSEERVKQGAIIQNRIFKNELQKYHYQYVSTEDILGRLDEPYKAYTKDPIKGDILLRASDGIHFSPTALRMISSTVVNAVTRLDKE